VIIYMDALGMRPVLVGIAQRLAQSGYVALLPDLFYRAGAYQVPPPKDVFAGSDAMTIIGPLIATTGTSKAAEDTGYFLDYLDSRSDVAGKVGTVGFCMGGGMAIAAAGTYPDRIAAVASFHGGRLATDAPDSPHLYGPKIRAEVYIAVADNDQSYPPEMEQRLEAAFKAAGVNFRSEHYSGALHGWMKPDFPIYNEQAAERGWREMLALFKRNLC
jgi:carboxymethylenebutenolidase